MLQNCQIVPRGAETKAGEDCSLRISLDKRIYRPGEAVLVSAELIDNTSQPQRIQHNRFPRARFACEHVQSALKRQRKLFDQHHIMNDEACKHRRPYFFCSSTMPLSRNNL